MANHVVLTGRLVKEPEVRYVTEKAVCNFVLAVERPVKAKDGRREADFIPCVAWGRLGEVIGNHVQKGHKIYVEGRIQVRTYEDKEGQKRYITEVNLSTMEFLEKTGTTYGGVEKNSTQAQPAGFGGMGTTVQDGEFEGLVF